MIDVPKLPAGFDFLDYSKKLWVYGKPLTLEMAVEMHEALGTVDNALMGIGLGYEFTKQDMIAFNAHKLVLGEKARYKTGKYSDRAAQDRADKQGEIPFEFKKPDDTEGGSND